MAPTDLEADKEIDFLSGGGEMGARMRAFDWSKTPLGRPATWPQSLRTVVRIVLTSRFAMWMAWGPDLTFFCNDAYLPTTGIKSDWILGSRSDLVWAEIWPDIGPRIRHVLATGEATWDEALPLYLERSGFPEETFHTFSYSPLADDDGMTVGMLCVVAEVTERIIGERQLGFLRDLGTRLAASSTRGEVMEALQQCLKAASYDLPFALTYLTRGDAAGLALVHGLEKGSRAAPATIAFDDPSAFWPLAQVSKSGAQLAGIAARDIAGLPLNHWQHHPRQALVLPLMASEASSGTPAGYFVAGLNPHRAADAAYRGFIELLTGQIAAAVARADLYERELARAEALAEIDRAKIAFFSNVSHEFRTPLTLMLGPLEELMGNPGAVLNGDELALVNIAYRNAQRLLRLVNALLDFSRLEAGRVVATFRQVDLGTVTTELVSTFRSACERAGLKLQVECEELAEPVFIDTDMWEKVVLNLVSNAFKFTFEGGIFVTLHAIGGRAVLEVRDTGAGIPERELPRLFERFHRVLGTQGRSFEGSGIGLALVHDLVCLHGGGVSVTSELGTGSTFRVEIPMGRDHLPADRIEASRSVPVFGPVATAFAGEALRWLPEITELDMEAGLGQAMVAAPGTNAGHVLLADDNHDLRDYVARLLSARGYYVEAVEDGEEALASLRSRRPDLLLTDVMMPRLDGLGLLAAIRSDPKLSDIPVVILSARAGEEAQVEGLDAGADDYLAKPFSARELLARVSANLVMAKVRREAAEEIRASKAKVQLEREFLASVLAKAPIGIAIIDGLGHVSMLNERAVELLGHRFEAASARDFDGYGAVHADGRPYRLDEYPALRAVQGERIDGERIIYTRGGAEGTERIILEVDAVPIRDADGQPAGAVTVFDDAGARDRAEEALRARVERAVAEQESAREALHQLQKLETIGQLTGGVAHDFNNLLTPILGGLDVLRRLYSQDERAQKIITGAHQSAERARVLVSRLLTFGRRQHLEAVPVDLAALVTGMADMIERSLSARIAITYDLGTGVTAVMADANQLELALLNLCVNARDAMPDGGSLLISVREVDRPGEALFAQGRYVQVAVADTGTGMDAETLTRAIEPFYTTKGAGKGTGLGLSMVHGLAAQSGGVFNLESRPGQGTIASIYLPVVAADLPAPQQLKIEPAAAIDPLVIVLVDDEELVRRGTAEILESLGHTVMQVASGVGALQLMRGGFKTDFLIADYMMPGMNGIDLIREVRSFWPTLPALLVTGYGGASARADDDVIRLGKPFGRAQLNAAIQSVLSSHGGNEARASSVG